MKWCVVLILTLEFTKGSLLSMTVENKCVFEFNIDIFQNKISILGYMSRIVWLNFSSTKQNKQMARSTLFMTGFVNGDLYLIREKRWGSTSVDFVIFRRFWAPVISQYNCNFKIQTYNLKWNWELNTSFCSIVVAVICNSPECRTNTKYPPNSWSVL